MEHNTPGYEVEPNLRQPGTLLYDAGNPQAAAADEISVEQRALMRALLAAQAGTQNEIADRIVKGLAQPEEWEYFGGTQAEFAAPGKLLRLISIERGGTWQIAGVAAFGDPANTADVTVTLDGIVPGFPVRVTAKRTDPTEVSLNQPMRSLDGSLTMTVAGGAAADRVSVNLRLKRYGARLGGGSL